MDFEYSSEQRAVREFAVDLLQRVGTEAAVLPWNDPDTMTVDGVWKSLADAELFSIGLPEEWGGAGGGVVETTLVGEQIGAHGIPVQYDCTVPTVGAAIAEFGSEELRSDILARMASGSVHVSMPAVDVSGETPPAVTLLRTGDTFTATGTLRHVPVVGGLDAVLAPVSIDGAHAVSGALVRLDRAGVTRRDVRVTDLTSEAVIQLDEVALEAADVFLPSRTDLQVWLGHRAVAATCGIQLGICTRVLELAARHCRERRQFGRALSDFQAVTQRLAEASIRLKAMQVTTWRLVSLLEQGQDTTAAAFLAKYISATAAPVVVRAAVHLHGGLGVDVTFPLARYVVMSKRYQLWLGGSGRYLDHLGAAIAAADDLDDLLLA